MIGEKAFRYFHTLRYLRIRQIFYQILRRCCRTRFKPLDGSCDCRPQVARWVPGPRRLQSLIGPRELNVLNRIYSVAAPGDWSRDDWPHLALYNLHYFDDLVAVDGNKRSDWQRELIRCWIDENTPGTTPGWDAYTISRRSVNWIKFALEGEDLSPLALSSLAEQLQHLSRTVEWHLLGNHVLANAKALIFGGLFFQGDTADRWLADGVRIWNAELDDQFLPDGGHFERSPMYHALMLEDALDVIGIHRAYGKHCNSDWIDLIQKMLRWLLVVRHPDGQIALLNDSATNVACSPDDLVDYATRLGISIDDELPSDQIHLKSTGYLRQRIGRATAIIDIAAIGPDHIPGHAHADSLSFELSLDEQRVIVDTGTSEYAMGEHRAYERSTSAHNTLEVDSLDSSEVWSAFRVARRARTRVLELSADAVVAEHDGYTRLTGVGIHRRKWCFGPSSLEIVDNLQGSGRHVVKLRFHLHPDAKPHLGAEKSIVVDCGTSGLLRFTSDCATNVTIEKGYHASSFGKREENRCIKAVYDGPLPVSLRSRFEWESR